MLACDCRHGGRADGGTVAFDGSGSRVIGLRALRTVDHKDIHV